MAFKLKRDQRHNFQASAAQAATVGVTPTSTAIASAYYNGKKLALAADGSASFTPLVGTYFLTVTVNPPYPPEVWQLVEIDGVNTQMLELEDSDKQVANLVIVGS